MSSCGRLIDVTPTGSTDTLLADLCANHLSRWQGEVLGGTSSWFVCDMCNNTCNAAPCADRYFQYKNDVNRCVQCVSRTLKSGSAVPGEVTDLGRPVGMFLDSMGDTEFVGVWGLDVSPTFHKPLRVLDLQDTLLALGSLRGWRCAASPSPTCWLFERERTVESAGGLTALYGVMHPEEGFWLFALPDRFETWQDALADFEINHIGFETFEEWMTYIATS